MNDMNIVNSLHSYKMDRTHRIILTNDVTPHDLQLDVQK